MDITTVQNVITDIEADATAVLQAVENLDPAVEVPVAAAEGIVALISGLIGKALSAWSAASGTPITQASVLALLPADTPLDAPTAGATGTTGATGTAS